MSELTKISVMFGNFGRNKKSFSRVSVCPLNMKRISYVKNCIFYMDNDGFAGNGSFDEKSFAFSHTVMTISVVSFLERDTKIDG